MKMSTRGRYGTRVMLELALRYKEEPKSLRDIAKNQEISPKYLVQIITSLKAAGLVKSIRRAGGGYILARPPSQITLSEVIGALEGSIAPVDCVDDPNLCHRADFCVMIDVWTQIKNATDKILGSLDLEKMAKMQKKKERKAHSTMKIRK